MEYMEQHTAKHFVLQLGSLASLYLSLAFLLVLVFAAINLAIPDAADPYWRINEYHTQARLGIAMVIVFFPTYLILTRLVNAARRQAQSGTYLGLTKWLIYLSLLVGGAVLLGDLVAVILAFLEGEVTERFILKATAVLLVIGAAFSYYVLDARGYWLTHELRSRRFGLAATLVVLTCVVGAFTLIEGPGTARERALDEEQIRDLQEIQYQLEDTLRRTGEVPARLSNLTTADELPTAPADRPAYRYEKSETGFVLCATFATASRPESTRQPLPPDRDGDEAYLINPNDWSHGVGETCFARDIHYPEET